jgi:hypothetical protein
LVAAFGDLRAAVRITYFPSWDRHLFTISDADQNPPTQRDELVASNRLAHVVLVTTCSTVPVRVFLSLLEVHDIGLVAKARHSVGSHGILEMVRF